LKEVLNRNRICGNLLGMLAKATTYAIEGVTARQVTVEVDIRRGLPSFSVVGLPDAAVRESRERVRAALLNEGFEFPQQRITANLAPAELHKAGPSFDLAIACALLTASGQIDPKDMSGVALVGELSLDGGVRPVRGGLAITEAAQRDGMRVLVVPQANVHEAALVGFSGVAPAIRLRDLVTIAAGEWEVPEQLGEKPEIKQDGPDLKDLRGHEFSQRALEIAAAGGHHVLFKGPPGCGKTMLARRLPSILPSLTRVEATEITRMQSISGNLRVDGLVTQRPFRAPHHTISASGLIGGGAVPTPGEVTLATNGVLFLDELAEFSGRTLESLRQPLEAGSVTVTRGQQTHTYPARFMLVAATNPCPCGAGGQRCKCTAVEVARYDRRLSGPLLDRFDMHCRVDRPTPAEVEAGPITESAVVRSRVELARARQADRFANEHVHCNGHLDGAQTRRLLAPPDSVRQLLNEAYSRGSLSLRGYDRSLRVARTIADLDDRDEISQDDMAEALAFRVFEPGFDR
jgi:magnesium chelatase family protein